MTSPVEIVSFGYGHGPAPEAHLAVDVRHHFRDPHVDPALRELTASDPAVMDAMYATPGVLRLAASIALAAHAYGHGPQPGPVTVAIGCAGGRHRAPAIADKVAYHLEIRGIPVTLTHRDMHRPVIARELTVPLGQPGRCWCGDLVGHEWPGKASGTPHPQPVAAGAQ